MDLKPTFEHYYPEGSIGGQCAAFAEKLVQFGPVGNSLAQKTAYVKAHGIMAADLHGDFRVGDVVVTDDSPVNGHIFIVNCILGSNLRATESNFDLHQHVNHTRLVPMTSKRIIGVIRGPLKVQIINPTPMFPIQMPFTAIANNLAVSSLANSLSAVAEMMKTYSRNRIDLPFDTKNTSFNSVPFADLAGIVGPETNWYRQNVTPLCTSKVSLFLMNDQQWQGNTTGAMTWGDSGKPGRISLHYIETTFVEQAFHELCHALLFFTGQKDGYVQNGEQRFVVHDYLFQNPPDKYGLLDLLDYTKLQSALNNIKPMDKIKIRSIGWNDAEKGLYFPFDTMDRQQALVKKLTDLFPDYELDPTEYNLGKRPWK
jgi:hypothetical protein